MPPIPTYERQAGIKTGSTGPDASAAAFGGEVARSLTAIGSGLYDASSAADKVAREQEALWVNQTVSQAHEYWAKHLQDMMTNAKPGADGFYANFDDEWKRFSGDYMKGAPNTRAANTLGMHLSDLKLHYDDQALNFEKEQRIAYRVNQLETSFDKSAGALAVDPSLYEQTLKENVALVRALSGTRPDQKLKLERHANEVLTEAAIDGIASKDPKSALDFAEKIAGTGRIDGRRIGAILEKLRNQTERTDAYALDTWHQSADSNLKQIETSGKPKLNFDPQQARTTAGGTSEQIKKDVEDYKKNEEYAYEAFMGKSALEGQSPPERQRYLDSIKPQANDQKYLPPGPDVVSPQTRRDYGRDLTFYQSLSEWNNADLKNQLSNPVGYARATFPEIGNAFDRVDELRKQQAPPAAVAAAQHYASSLAYSAQDKMGVPKFLQSPIDLDQAKSIALDFQKNPDADAVAARFRDLATTYGDDYGRVISTMANRIPEAARLKPEYLNIGESIGTPQEQLTIKAAQLKQNGTIDKLYPDDGSKKKLNGYIEGTQEFRDLVAATGKDRTEYAANKKVQLASYAMTLRAEGLAATDQEAAEQASRDLIPFEAGQVHGETYLIPKSMTDDQKQVIRTNLGEDKLMSVIAGLPAKRFDPTQFNGTGPTTSPEVKKQILEDDIMRTGFWVTSDDGKNVMLFKRPAFGSGRSQPVRDAKGQVFSFPLDSLSTGIINPKSGEVEGPRKWYQWWRLFNMDAEARASAMGI